MDLSPEAFSAACEKAAARPLDCTDIGRLGEKILHASLKLYLEPDTQKHERKIESFVADIVNETGVIEIQTRSFEKLRNKLTAFLEAGPVTVVYPLAAIKWISWLDTQTGQISAKRKSPKRGVIQDIFFELYKIKSLILHENFRLCILLLEVEDLRTLNGWSADKKKGSSRHDRFPVQFLDICFFNELRDYKLFVPESLPETFTVKDYQKACKISLRQAGHALNVLRYVKAVKQAGKFGRAFLYTRINDE